MPLVASVPNAANNLSVNLALSQGEVGALQLTVSTGGAPINLTSYTVKMQIEFQTPVDLTTGNGGITITNAAAGQLQINVTAAQSEAWALGSYPYDLFILSSGGASVIRVIAGLFTLIQSVTPIP